MSSDLCVFFVSGRPAVLRQILYIYQEQQSKLGVFVHYYITSLKFVHNGLSQTFVTCTVMAYV
jgi:hypothetical protein